jgi:DNA-binding IclR family transcriptional regulator
MSANSPALSSGAKRSRARARPDAALTGTPATALKGAAALGKAMQVLDLVAHAAAPPSFAELAQASGLPRATLHRLLGAWIALEMVASTTDRRYRPGIHLLTLARHTWERLDVRSAAQAPMRHLNAATGETVQLAVLSGDAIVWVDKLESVNPLRLHSAIGGRGPVHCTAVGKAMLAFLDPVAQRALLWRLDLVRHTPHTLTSRTRLTAELDDVRRAVVAFDREEHREGIHCVASPVLDHQGRVAGAISVTAPVSRVDARALRGFAPLVREAAAQTARALGGGTPPLSTPHPAAPATRRRAAGGT